MKENTPTTKLQATIIKETEKAYQVSAPFWVKKGDKPRTAKIWVPKSCAVVSDGVVTEIANFVLDRWANDYMEFAMQQAHGLQAVRSMNRNWNVCFDMDKLTEVNAQEQAKKDAYKQELAETVQAAYDYCIDNSNRYIMLLGTICQFLAHLHRNDGVLTQQQVTDLDEIGHRIEKDFGIEPQVKAWMDGNETTLPGPLFAEFTKWYPEFEDIRDFMWEHTNGEHPYYCDFYNGEVCSKLRRPNGEFVNINMLKTATCDYNSETRGALSPLGKKMKKQFAYWMEIRKLVMGWF